MIEYSIVIPAYNESQNISSSLIQVISFMRGFNPSFEVVVVDDGSGDSTVEIVKKIASENPEVRLIENPHKGKGPTVYTGILSSEGNYICMADADMATPISELKRLSNWIIEHKYDLVIASREGMGARRVGEPYYRHLMGRVFNFLVQIIALPGINDSQCGFKLFKSKAAKDIFSKLKIYGASAKEIKDAYFGAFDVEVLYLAKKLGYKIKELPVEWTYVHTVRLNPLKDSYRMLKDVFVVRFNDLKGKYN